MIVPAPPMPSSACAMNTDRPGVGPPNTYDVYITVIATKKNAESTWTKRRKSYTGGNFLRTAGRKNAELSDRGQFDRGAVPAAAGEAHVGRQQRCVERFSECDVCGVVSAEVVAQCPDSREE